MEAALAAAREAAASSAAVSIKEVDLTTNKALPLVSVDFYPCTSLHHCAYIATVTVTEGVSRDVVRLGVTFQVNDRHGSLGLRGKVPRNVHGGALLGVTYRQPLHSAQGGNAFQFYSWATQEATGEVGVLYCNALPQRVLDLLETASDDYARACASVFVGVACACVYLFICV
jgi:hypothetical protein